MHRRSAAVLGIGGVGGDRLDREKLEQPGEARVEIGIDPRQHLVEFAHA
jgi:hypothetical protein